MHRRELLRLLSLATLAGASRCAGPSAGPHAAALSPETTPRAEFVPDVEFILTVLASGLPQPTRAAWAWG